MNGDSSASNGPEAHSRIEAIFHEALSRVTGEDRSRFVEEACGADESLRDAVSMLLDAHDAAEPSFLEGNALSNTTLSAEASFAFLRSEQPGEMFENYRLIERIGEGGFGTVWMAEQQKPVRRHVALKVIKLGMDTREVIARFEAERQALALMDHPNIAKVFDAGATPTGRPFFVMELVRGTRITDYCDEANLSSNERLRLFTEVCHAIQHAHQKGIIHRDLKPSNVLVSLQDGVPVPKVIDFGVAKAVDQRLTDSSVMTQFEQMIGTPLYMSPEQAEMRGPDIDTRSDIYSLGVLLYELLIGRTPFDPNELMRRGLDEIRRVIREEDPPRPSTALSTMAEDSVVTIARRRQSEPPKLVSLLRGDLDWIVMRALEKDRSRRYDSASAFAEDVKRHLANEPVLARPPSRSYRFQRFVKRNKIAFAAAIGITTTLVAGIAVSSWQAVRANQALTELRASAPAFIEQAKVLAETERFDEALEKLEYAVKLRPDYSEYLSAKADLLQAVLKLGEASDTYRAALKLAPKDPHAQRNLQLCERLLASNPNPNELSYESLSILFAALQRDQRPAAYLIPLARRIGAEGQLHLQYWTARLASLPIPPGRPLEQRLTRADDGLLALDLSDTRVSDLKQLKGMPLGELNCSGCTELVDITPLRDLPLRSLSLEGCHVYDINVVSTLVALKKLRLDNTKVIDLLPLHGLALTSLSLNNLEIHDFSPLRGLPLEELIISGARITDFRPLSQLPLRRLEISDVPALDLSPLAGVPLQYFSLRSAKPYSLDFLRGSPLRELFLSDCGAYDLSFLSEIESLETLSLPNDYHTWANEKRAAIAHLRTHPKLRRIGVQFAGDQPNGNLNSAEKFWQLWDREAAVFDPFRSAGIRFIMRELADGTWEADFEGEPITDLAPLKGARITRLGLKRTKVVDLSPLEGMSLRALTLRGTNVEDLRPLSKMPLEELDISGTRVTDLSPLKNLPLKRLGIEETKITDLSPLRGMRLQEFWTGTTQISDLSPLRGVPLRVLHIDDCPRLTDVSPLADIPTLEQVLLPKTARNVEVLQALPRLRYISVELDGSVNRPSQSAEEFWALKEPISLDKLAREKRFADLERLLRLRLKSRTSSEEWKDYLRLASVVLMQGEQETYRAICTEMLNRLKDSKPDEILKVCCLMADSGVPPSDLQRLLDASVMRHENVYAHPWTLISCGLGEFRLGRTEKAIEWLERVGDFHADGYTIDQVVLAMAYHKMGDTERASKHLSTARFKLSERTPEGPSNPAFWQDTLIGQILFNEAEQLIGGRLEALKVP